MATTESLIASITAILTNNNLHELSLGDTDLLTEPTNVVWYDKDGYPYDDRVTGVFLEDGELTLEVYAAEFDQSECIYQDDFAFTHIDWLLGIRDNMLEVLQRDGRRRCPVCGKVIDGQRKYCSDACCHQDNPAAKQQVSAVMPNEGASKDNPFVALVQQAHAWQNEARRQIVETLRKQGGRVTFTPMEEDGDYPVTSTLYGKHDFPHVNLTDVYLEEGYNTYIIADGIDTESGEKRKGVQIYDEQLYDIALFLKYVL